MLWLPYTTAEKSIHQPHNIMKKTLSLLALTALTVGTSMGADEDKTITVRPKFPYNTSTGYEIPSSQYGSTIAPGATLIDTSTGGVVTYDEADDVDVIEAPFNISEGIAFTTLTLDLSDIVLDDVNKLIIDFTDLAGTYQPQTWAMYLQAGHTGDYDQDTTPDNVDYLFIKIEGFDFATWYQKNSPVEIIGRFIDEIEYYPGTSGIKSWTTIESTAFVITDACDVSSEGGIAFFSEDVIDDVRNTEVIPEPTTTTLSLLALAGLVARRRRK